MYMKCAQAVACLGVYSFSSAQQIFFEYLLYHGSHGNKDKPVCAFEEIS